jgi:hypothetical protein
MRFLGYMVALFLGFAAQAADVNGSQWPTLDAAAVYALHMSAQMSSEYEYGGILIKNKDHYSLTMPHTDHDPGSLLIDKHLNPESGYKMVGMYHTHPCNPRYIQRYFSINDTAHAIYDYVPSYMMDMCTHSIYKFDPDVDMPDNAGVGRTTGRLIGYDSLTITKR